MRFAASTILVLFFCQVALSQEKYVNVHTMPEWPPGSFVPVRIEIINPLIGGFARFYQDLPQGFTVKKGQTAESDFYWDNNQVNFVWVKTPGYDTIRISYLAKADESLTGSFRLGGKLDYVINGDERKTLEFGPVIIHLDKNARVDEDIEDIIAETEAEPAYTITADTVTREEQEEKVEFRVQVAISSDQISKPELESRIGCSLKYGITVLTAGNMYKYQSGNFAKYTEASVYLDELKKMGVKDAFIVAYRGREQISIELARTLTE